AETKPARARAEPGQQVEGGRDLAIAGEVVLDDEGAVKAERLGLDVVFDEVAEALAAVELGTTAPRCGAAEETELHPSHPPLRSAPAPTLPLARVPSSPVSTSHRRGRVGVGASIGRG